MDRVSAIELMVANEHQVEQEFCVTQAERDAGETEFREAMLTLGVTEAELDGRYTTEIAGQCPVCKTVLNPPQVDEIQRVPWGIRLAYAARALRGKLRPVGPVDVSHLETDGWMEGRVRVQVRG